MKRSSIIILLLVYSTLSLFAQENNDSIFSNELVGEKAFYNHKNSSIKNSNNTINKLFTNEEIYWPMIHVAIDVFQKDSFYYVLGSYPDNSFLTKFDMQGDIVLQKTNDFINEPNSLFYFPSNKLAQFSDGTNAYLSTERIYDTIRLYPRYVPVVKYFDDSLKIKGTYYWNDTIQFYPGGGIIADKNKSFTLCGKLASRTMNWIQVSSTYGYYNPDSLYLGIISIDSNFNVIRKTKRSIQLPNCITTGFVIQDLERAHDGGYIVGGSVSDCGRININGADFSSYTPFAIKYDSLLNYQWMTLFGDSTADNEGSPFNIVPSKDGENYIFTHEHNKTQSIAYGKFNDNGEILWEKYFRKSMEVNYMAGELIIYDRPNGVIEKDNGDIIFGCRINVNKATGLVRTDSVGNVKWSRVISTKYGDSLMYYSYVFNVKNPIGEGALLVGRVHTMGAFLIRTDSLGCTLPNCLDTTLHVSIEEIVALKEQDLIVYPNPALNTIQIAVNKQGEKIEQIAIFDINGREIFSETLNTFLFTKEISDLSNGVYIINVKGNKGSILTKKFIKQ